MNKDAAMSAAGPPQGAKAPSPSSAQGTPALRGSAAHAVASVGAMVLAAGRGERMRPLTDSCPKPLLEVQNKPLLQWAFENLARGGVREVLVNTAWLGEQIETRFGAAHGEQRIHYSHEGRDFGHALETAGGIVRALPHLAERFWLLAGDVFAPDFVFEASAMARFEQSGMLAHLWLVPNPEHNPKGDFAISPEGLLRNSGTVRHTYSTIGVYHRDLFAGCGIAPGNPSGQSAPLAPLLRAGADAGRISAELYLGAWTDVGTPQRLAALNLIA